MNSKKHLEYYSRVYPDAWKYVDKFREGRGKELPFWPEWCFLPLSGAFAIVSSEAERQGIDIYSEEGMRLINDVGILGALAAWRVTQGIYRFDPDVYREVIETPVTGDLPHEVLFNLPEWCIYIETPGLNFFGMPLAGFFAYLEFDAGSGRKELRIVLDHTFQYETPRLMSQVIHLGPWSLLESIEKAMREAEAQAERMSETKVSMPTGTAEIFQDNFMPLVSLVLYICSANGEIGDGEHRPIRPRSKKTKKGIRMFPPQKVSIWDVGIRMGAALRKAREIAETRETGERPSRSSPRPHVRRAHWQGYWTGPRDSKREYILKWISPILVGQGEIHATIRPVK